MNDYTREKKIENKPKNMIDNQFSPFKIWERNVLIGNMEIPQKRVIKNLVFQHSYAYQSANS